MIMKVNYKPIALRDDYNGKSVISFNTETKRFSCSVGDKSIEPLTLRELEVLRDNLTDVLEMKGRYLFIKDYDNHTQ